jgi:hypothetical protein
MANLALSILNIGQAKVTAKNQEPEQRRKIPTVLGLALQNQEFSIPDAATLRTSPLRPVQIYFKKDIAAGSGTTKSYNHTGTFGDSGYVTVTYVSVVETCGIPLKIGANNVYTYQDVFDNQYEMMWKNVEDRLDNAGLAFLYANRTQLSTGVMNPLLQSAGLTGWNGTTYALEIPDTQKQLFLQKVKDAMFARNYRSEIDVVADIQSGSNFENYMNQGSGNQNNLSWQFTGVNLSRSAAVLDTNYTAGSVFAMPKGIFAGLNWNEMLNRTGLPNPDMGGTIGMVGTQVSPRGSGLVADISMYTQRADTSANTTGGSTQDFVLQTELTGTIGFVTAPLSLASDSPIMEISQLGGVS